MSESAGKTGAAMSEAPEEAVIDAQRTREDLVEALKADSLRKSYRGRCVVDNVSITVDPGEVVGLLGPNGAGKTTTFYMIVGLESPDSGRIRIGEQDITRWPMYKRARRGVSYLPQEPSIFRKLTVEENLLAILETLDLSRAERLERVETLLEEFHLSRVRRSKGYALSGGERRRTEIARCLTIEPKFILLDEPFAGIDPIAIDEIQRLILRLRDRGIGVLITDHNVREALTITDRAFIINDGRIFRTGTPNQLTGDPEVRRVYLGEKFKL
ncbi:MAG: LPS export ABC transporter ATP-binding protein [Blastocatellales bacterium]|nr:LPS export ABC transporter ATP-binding protein [Blastocatellales bacterium]